MKPDDPVSQGAARAIEHLNDDHADALLEMAQALGGRPGGDRRPLHRRRPHRPRPDRHHRGRRGRGPGRLRRADRGAAGPAQGDRQARPEGAGRAGRRSSARLRLNRDDRAGSASSRTRLVRPSSACAVVQVGVGLVPAL